MRLTLVFLFLTLTRATDTLLVTGSRIPRTFPAMTRQVQTITREEIGYLPAHSLADILDRIVSMDMQQRGPYGMQTDASIRGATFEQVLILVDGVRYNNTQTGHHHLDLPVALADIQRIEVLSGHGSAIYGADAFGGVINIVTQRGKKDNFRTRVALAEHSTYTAGFRLGRQGDHIGQSLSVERSASDGYWTGTDFKSLILGSQFSWDHTKGKARLTARYADKDFGAYDFYTPGKEMPSREKTAGRALELANTWQTGPVKVASQAFFRQHYDKFILDRFDPLLYQNEHTTQGYGVETHIEVLLPDHGKLAVGVEAASDLIRSSNLGNHQLPRYAVFLEVNSMLSSRLFTDLGGRLDISAWGKQFSPVLGISYWPIPVCKVRASAGRAFRSPSFTELYYQDPYNQGRASLVPEEAVCGEVGVDLVREGWQAGTNIFFRHQRNLIDWVHLTTADTIWRAINTGQTDIIGWEVSGSIEYRVITARLNYTLLHLESNNRYTSKYAFRFARHHLSASIGPAGKPRVRPVITASYKARPDEGHYLVLNAKVSTRLTKKLDCYIEGTNLLDEDYEAVTGVPQAGRWLGAGIGFRL